MQWLRTRGLQLSFGVPSWRPDMKETRHSNRGKFHLTRRLGMNVLVHGAGVIWRGEAGSRGMFLVTLLYFRLSVPFPLSMR